MSKDSDASPLLAAVYHSAQDVPPDDWNAAGAMGELAMDLRMIAVQERSLAQQCRMFHVLLRRADGRPAACASLALFAVDGGASAHPVAGAVVDLARRAWPGLLRFNVLFCGLPAPAGESHLRAAAHADLPQVMRAMNTVMHTLAQRHGATLLVFKEFAHDAVIVDHSLRAQGYLAGDVPPMYRLRGPFADFDSFLARMRSRYRAQVRRSLRKIESGGLTITHHRLAVDIHRTFTPRLHALYEEVWKRAEHRLERLPREFFLDLATALPERCRLTVIHRGEREVGFTFSLIGDHRWHNLYSGVDYSINGEGDILFNLFYADLRHAFESGCDEVLLGQTSDEFKSRLGALAGPLRFYVKARSALVHAGLRAFSPALFPEVAVPRAPQVFRAAQPANRRPTDQPTAPLVGAAG